PTTMRIGFVSDIHSNKEALDAALAELDSMGIDRLYCMGDIVGYGAEPNYCADVIRERAQAVVMGNHDYAVLHLEYAQHFNPYARAAAEWTAEQLSAANLAFLMGLETTQIREEVTLVHGSLRGGGNFEEYVQEVPQAKKSFEELKTRLVFVGHTHYPEVYIFDPESRQARHTGLYNSGFMYLDEGKQYFVNIGSTGQPRDGDARSSCCLYDTEEGTIEIIRVAYDIDAAAQKIIAAQLPEFLAQRLYVGR
ncbi:MAG TPA: metallophosphoesterase family protein, partial [bacterium]|nr:metallophosphoesterase family protein [bacterium]